MIKPSLDQSVKNSKVQSLFFLYSFIERQNFTLDIIVTCSVLYGSRLHFFIDFAPIGDNNNSGITDQKVRIERFDTAGIIKDMI